MEPILTIGMSTYDDFDGVFFSIQALRLYHGCMGQHVEFLVIDNNPTSAHGKAVSDFLKWIDNARYIPYTERSGTAVRDEIFKQARGTYTLCMDCHVMFEPDGIKHLLEYYARNPDTKNLVQGPLWHDDLKGYQTHFRREWGSGMYGKWDTDYLGMIVGEPFEIPMQGLGMFSCKTSEWAGFNKKFKGFGAEEGYIHEKFRQNGGKCLCLPNVKWNHRFGRPNGVPYHNAFDDRLWNYFVGWLEIYKDPNHPFMKEIKDHFFTLLPPATVEHYFSNAIKTITQ